MAGYSRQLNMQIQPLLNTNGTQGAKRNLRAIFTKMRKVRVNADLELSIENHDKLVGHIMAQIHRYHEYRCLWIDRLRRIDQDVAGVRRYDPKDDEADCAVARRRALGLPAPLPNVNLQLTSAQLDDASTSMTTMMFPQSGMYQAQGPKTKINYAKALSQKMQEDGQYFKHYTHYTTAVMNALKYNWYGALVEYKRETANALRRDSGELVASEKEGAVVYEGNRVMSLDPYNTVWDMRCAMMDVNTKGMFVGTIEMEDTYWVARLQQQNAIYGPKWLAEPDTYGHSFTQLYERRPSLFGDEYSHTNEEHLDNNGARVKDWKGWGGHGNYGSKSDTADEYAAVEVANIYMRIIPKHFGLSTGATYETWLFTIVDGTFIVKAARQPNLRGKLPVGMGTLAQSEHDYLQHSMAERLNRMQEIAEEQLDLHFESTRKKLKGGLTIYNPYRIPLGEVKDAKSGFVPARMSTFDDNLSRHVLQLNDVPQTNTSFRDLSALTDIMQGTLPTNQAGQIAGLERATEYQAAAAVQAANKIIYKFARLMDDQAFSDVRMLQLWQLQVNDVQLTFLDDESGQEQRFEATQAEELGIQFLVGDGLRGIDQIRVQTALKETMNMVVQGRLQEQGVDLMGLLDYFMTVNGDETDLTQFRSNDPFMQLSPEQKQLAVQLLQQAEQQQQGGAAGQQQQVAQ